MVARSTAGRAAMGWVDRCDMFQVCGCHVSWVAPATAMWTNRAWTNPALDGRSPQGRRGCGQWVGVYRSVPASAHPVVHSIQQFAAMLRARRKFSNGYWLASTDYAYLFPFRTRTGCEGHGSNGPERLPVKDPMGESQQVPGVKFNRTELATVNRQKRRHAPCR